MASEPRVARFGATERNLHTIHGVAFTVLLGTGLALYLPMFARVFGDRPLMKGVHLVAAVAWLTALVLVVILGDRRALRRTRQDLERFDDDDLLWLRRRPAPHGRFNAGQKVHAILQAGLAALFTVSGVLLWLGERDTAFRLPGTIALHDAAMFLATVLVGGHIYKALGQPGALEGISRGTVSARYAAKYHPKWRPEPLTAAVSPGAAQLAAATVVVALAIAGAVLLSAT